MKGTRTVHVGNITINTMSEEARNLLNRLRDEYKRQTGRDIRTLNGYQAIYWACKYSGMIEPKVK